jgi:hypothetical protein
MSTPALSTTRPSNILRRAMRGNALFSAVSGLLSLIEARPLAAFTGLDTPAVFVGLGITLLAYAAVLFVVTNGETVQRQYGIAAVILDVAWVAGSAAILLSGWPELTTAGRWTVALLAEAVAFFAAWQWYGLRR